MQIQSVWDEANRLKGCLAGQKTLTSRRHGDTDEYADSGNLLDVTDQFLSDEAGILQSKAFRVMRDKTQVFTFTSNPLIRTRLSHVMEVVACSIMTSEMLGLNTSLVRAAAAGHDIGHVPFGHQGEAWLAKAMGRPFCHEHMGVITAQRIERRGRGLNLTFHTLEAMMRHSGNTAREGMSQEAWVLRHADKFAYIFHDYNDIVNRVRYPVRQELVDLVNSFGQNQRQRTSTAIAGLVIESAELGRVSFEQSDLGRSFLKLRGMMYELYPAVTQQDVNGSLGPVLDSLQRLKIGEPFMILALMTDSDVRILKNATMIDMPAFNLTTVSEMFPYLAEIGQVDLCDPGLDW